MNLKCRLSSPLIYLISAFFFITLCLSTQLFSQNRNVIPAKPIPLRQVSGIVQDSSGQSIIGATISLISTVDTLRTSTNENGIFVFKNVKSWIFTIKISSIGYIPKIIQGKYNDATPRLTLDPILLKSDQKILAEVTVNGTPSIVYKTDTVEYRASDYVVRAGATVDELLQKMEGIEVGNDGSVTVNGTAVAKARLNGKDIYGGDVATTIQNLPADIVDKVQIVDDYGNTAARTGIKDGDPIKVLNLTTRTDRSVGNMARLNGGLGTIDQAEVSANLTRLNMNQTITMNANFQNTPNGIAGGSSSVGRLGGTSNRGGRSGTSPGGIGGGGASGGTNTRALPAFTFRDHFGKKINFLANYSFRYNDNNSITKSYSETYSTLGTTLSQNDGGNLNNSRTHIIKLELEYNPDSANYFQFQPNINLSSSISNNNSTIFKTGLIHQNQYNISSAINSTPTFGGTIAYQHVWLSNKARSLAFEATFDGSKNENESGQNNNIIYYQDDSKTILKDSLIHRLINSNNLKKSSRASLTYSEPLSHITRLEINTNIERRGYDNSKLTSNLDLGGNPLLIDSLSNIFNYHFTQYRNSINYKYGNNTSLFNFSLGLTAVSTSLKGTKESLGTSINQTYLKLIPIARLQVRLSNTHRIVLNYNGRASEPSFNQLQPVRDVSNPQNVIVGNPDLAVAFTHSLIGQYSNYIANSKLNYDLRLRSSFTEDQISSNVLQIQDAYGSLKNETRYINISGNHSHGLDYTLSKNFNDRKVSLSLSGNMENSSRTSMSNDFKNYSDIWGFKESFGPRLNPNTWLEINPYVSFDFNKINYSLARSTDIVQKIWALSLDGNIYFLKNLQFGYAISKNYVSGIGTNVSNNPLIINTMLQMKVFKNKGSLQLRAYDLLNENNFVNRTSNERGFTELLTNPNSRYVMINLSMNLQKWSGAIGKGGKNIIRRGDGSFIN